MNILSLSQYTIQNQPLWIDDPLDVNSFVTGVTPLSSQDSLIDYAMELVSSYASFYEDHYKLDLDMLSSPLQFEFSRLYIESIDREIEWACYGEDQSLNSDFICAILALLKDVTPETQTNFAQITIRNILIYYKDTLQKILDTACEDYFCNEMRESGYYAEQEMDNGDVIWRR